MLNDFDASLTRRSAIVSAAAFLLFVRPSHSAEEQVVTVHKDLRCGCCSIWMQHLQKNGFVTKAVDTNYVDAVKLRFGVPADLATCHTAEVAGYVIEGHVPAIAIKRLLAEKPNATGLAVAGMPVGSPGMEGGTPVPYDVVLFGPSQRRIYMRFIGERQL
ncbi:MAG: DUF411 domain-containing protein [Rhizobiales bacterium]|nr:DUF411 domain-containing protein [Hyphomicrobiales bacterium]